MYQIESEPCATMIPESDSVRANINAPINDSPIATSYETICALERKPPSSAYFEFDDQPARINASTPTLETANTSNKPMFTSAITDRKSTRLNSSHIPLSR